MEEKLTWWEAWKMKRIYILVEGQTEEAFVNELLVPYYSRKAIHLTPIIVSTSPGYKGGVTSYKKIKPQIEKLCKQDVNSFVTTLFDLYALPQDFPGKNNSSYPRRGTGQQKARFLESALGDDVNLHNFIPNLLVHEYEALLFAQINAFEQWVDNDKILDPLKRICNTTSPEDINDDPKTAPSKRILAVWQGYQKTFHGPLIACDIGLDVIRNACPHFDEWLKEIE